MPWELEFRTPLILMSMRFDAPETRRKTLRVSISTRHPPNLKVVDDRSVDAPKDPQVTLWCGIAAIFFPSHVPFDMNHPQLVVYARMADCEYLRVFLSAFAVKKASVMNVPLTVTPAAPALFLYTKVDCCVRTFMLNPGTLRKLKYPSFDPRKSARPPPANARCGSCWALAQE